LFRLTASNGTPLVLPIIGKEIILFRGGIYEDLCVTRHPLYICYFCYLGEACGTRENISQYSGFRKLHPG